MSYCLNCYKSSIIPFESCTYNLYQKVFGTDHQRYTVLIQSAFNSRRVELHGGQATAGSGQDYPKDYNYNYIDH